MSRKKPIELLLIEDNIPDVELLKFLFGNCDVTINFHCAYDGTQGSDFLFKRNKYSGSPTPDLIVMDLNIPRKDGRELLKEIKPDTELCRIPVIMLSTSSCHTEISEAYCLGASAFITKPPQLEVFQETIRSLVDFWFRRIVLPTR